jgi:hypothetical protein
MLRVREGYERRGGSIIGIASRGQHHIEGQVGTAARRADDCGDGGDGGEAAGAAAVAFLGIRPSLESSSG